MKLKHSSMLLCVSLIIAGCGLKGDLYEPGTQPESKGIIINEQTESVEKDSVETLVDEVMQEKETLDTEESNSTSSSE